MNTVETLIGVEGAVVDVLMGPDLVRQGRGCEFNGEADPLGSRITRFVLKGVGEAFGVI